MSKVNNIFDLLQDDDDDQPQQKEVSKPAAVVAPKEAKKPADKAPKTDKPVIKTSPKLTGEKKPFNKDDKPRRAPRQDGQVSSSEDFAKRDAKRDSKRETRKPRTDSAGNVRGRQFDRKSGTGRPINGEDKKGGSGRGNWGKSTEQSQPQDVEATEATTTEQTAEAAAEAVDTTPKEVKLTLEEYQQQQQKESVQQDGQKLRKAGEGESTSQWDDFVPLQTRVVKTQSKGVAAGKEEKKPKKQIINLEPKPQSNNYKNNKRGGENKTRALPADKDFPALAKA